MKTIKRKINIAFSILMSLVLISTGIFLFFYFSNFFINNLEMELIEKARMVAQSINEEQVDQSSKDELQNYVEAMGEETDYRFTIIRDDGFVLAESERSPSDMENHMNRPEIQTALREGKGLHTRFSDTLNKDLLYAAVPIYNQYNGEENLFAFARVAFPLNEIQQVRATLALIIGSISLFALGLTWVFGSYIARTITYPLEALTKWTKQVSKGNFHRELNISSEDEVGELAFQFYQMEHSLSDMMTQLKAEKNKLSVLLKNMPDGIIEIDGNRNVTLINPAAKKFMNLTATPSETFNIEKPLIALTRNYDLNQAVSQVLDFGQQIARETYIGDRNIRFYVTPIPSFQDNEKRKAVIILQDITDLTKLEKVRKEFIANISHELKTPLTSIQGFVETIKEELPQDNEEHQEFLDIIKQESKRVARLIEDLTVLSRLETNREAIQSKIIDVPSFLNKVISIASERWKQGDYFIYKNAIPSSTKAFLDPDKIQQVILNLIDNACSHNPPGTKIKIKAFSIDHYIRFSITDSGQGIPKSELERIFERFYKVDKSRYKDYGGTGLGLSIAKHILKAHNSELYVRSKLGVGTTFYFYVRRALNES